MLKFKNLINRWVVGIPETIAYRQERYILVDLRTSKNKDAKQGYIYNFWKKIWIRLPKEAPISKIEGGKNSRFFNEAMEEPLICI